jgi:hypothetical protein
LPLLQAAASLVIVRAVSLVGCLATGLLVACGEGRPPARYDVFTIELVGPSEGERVFPGQTLTFRTRYAGDLVRNLQFKATFTHESSGESASVQWSEPPEDTASIDVTRRWTLRHEFLERSGRIRVQLQAAVTATRSGSTPWETESQSVFVELYPTLDSLEVRLPMDPPLPYSNRFVVRSEDRHERKRPLPALGHRELRLALRRRSICGARVRRP